MFNQNKWDAWWDSLPKHTKAYLKTQPVWHDRDMFKSLAVGILLGIIIGAIL